MSYFGWAVVLVAVSLSLALMPFAFTKYNMSMIPPEAFGIRPDKGGDIDIEAEETPKEEEVNDQ